MRIAASLIGLALLTSSQPAIAQTVAPTPEQYVAHVGGGATLVAPGEFELDGKQMSCGRFPTVLDPALDDFSAAYEGFLIINPRRIARLTSAQKRWVFGVACGYQFRVYDPEGADCYSIQKGFREGWLNPDGLEEVCRFITPAKGRPAEDIAPGVERCAKMRRCLATG
jgi:hypothetical protein